MNESNTSKIQAGSYFQTQNHPFNSQKYQII